MKLQIPDDVVFRILGDEAVILNLSTAIYFGLDSVGTRIWQLIPEHGSTEKILETLWAEYEVEESQLLQDFDNLIGQLKDKGLLTIDSKEIPQSG
jgi:hypothetical protein